MGSDIEKAAKMIDKAGKVIALTGAGISTESGIPDFRSPGGLWTRFDPAIYATYDAYVRTPEKFWEMSQELNPMLENAEPNSAHQALAELEKLGKCEAVITQNVDNLHQRAGTSEVLELHGNYHTGTCLSCKQHYDYEYFADSVKNGTPPRCEVCDGLVKPDVVLFGEPLSPHVLRRAEFHAIHCDLMLVIGCGLEIYPAASLPFDTSRNGGKLVFFNLRSCSSDELADLIVTGNVGETVPEVVEAYKKLTGRT
ncbi:MAG: NAD-dependent deacylase [Actinobacteria bacterium]|nr:NAD-dependent deacylase [Actinomycetota bacterium]